jgi:hypothetical protein
MEAGAMTIAVKTCCRNDNKATNLPHVTPVKRC